MDTLLNIATIMFDPMLLAITVIYVYGFVARVSLNSSVRSLIMGVTFGFGAMFAMLTPMVFADGVIVDMRNLLIGLSGAFFGVFGAIATVFIAITTRIVLGGDGALAGIVGMILSCSAGLFWANSIKGKLNRASKDHAALGLMISVHVLAVFFLPSHIALQMLAQIAPILILFNLIGAILIGGLLTREEALIAENEALVNAATTDPLTRLHNRRSAMQAYEDLPAIKKESHGTAMLCFDIDKFKTINDSHGHVFGDAVLAEISQRIDRVLRPTDIFSRLGGDEFLVILPSVTRDETQAIAERCRAEIAEEAVNHDDRFAPVTISVGAEWLPDRPEFVTFLARADDALYKAKRLGRDCVAFAWQNAAQAAQTLTEPPQQQTA